MGEVYAAAIPDGENRLAAMEATGGDYTSFRDKAAKVLAGSVSALVAMADTLVTPLADQIIDIKAKLATAPLGIGEFSTATLPAASANPDRFAYVTDLFGAVRDKVAAVKIGNSWYWVPTRTFARTNVPIGSVTLGALTSPTTILFNGTLLASAMVTLSTANAYPGARLDIGFDGTISIGSITIAGLLGNATTALGANGRKTFFYVDNNDGTFGWKAF